MNSLNIFILIACICIIASHAQVTELNRIRTTTMSSSFTTNAPLENMSMRTTIATQPPPVTISPRLCGLLLQLGFPPTGCH